ncbi:MAG: protein-glutamate O-methyltransferase CheR [Desulfonauticus sp.]|nr:protein-glutamate O-methyltransferase CheR [Desulfonauticus sp.]
MAGMVAATINLNKDIRMSDEDFSNLREFIYTRTGIYLQDNRRYLLENRLISRLLDLNLTSFKDYYSFLRYDPGREEEITRLFDLIITKETSFFRDIVLLNIFQEVILKEIVKNQLKQNKTQLRIWSAGCSTGDEAYTIAIILCEMFGDEIDNWDVKIIANDLSRCSLKFAQRGIYSPYSLRHTPIHLIKKYFKRIGSGKYQIIPKLGKLVKFVHLNLTDPFKMKRMPIFQVIFCRNVLVYFGEDTQKRVLGFFYDKLVDNGYLLLGHSELLPKGCSLFKPIRYEDSIVYKKVVQK